MKAGNGMLDLEEVRGATQFLLEDKRVEEEARAREQRRQEKKRLAYQTKLNDRASRYALDLIEWITTDEYREVLRFLEAAAPRTLQLGSYRPPSGAILPPTIAGYLAGSGFLLDSTSEPTETTSLDDLARIGMCFIKAIEEPEYRGEYPGGIVPYIRARIAEMIRDIPYE